MKFETLTLTCDLMINYKNKFLTEAQVDSLYDKTIELISSKVIPHLDAFCKEIGVDLIPDEDAVDFCITVSDSQDSDFTEDLEEM